MSKLISPNGKPLTEEKPKPFLPTMCVENDENGKIVDPPKMATIGSAGYDLAASSTVKLEPGDTCLIPTGVRIAIPGGYYGQICSRSGLCVKHGISVSQGVGVIDSDYRGEIMVPLTNNGHSSYTINCGDKIAQMIFLVYAHIKFQIVTDKDELPESSRGTGGFGSTGT